VRKEGEWGSEYAHYFLNSLFLLVLFSCSVKQADRPIARRKSARDKNQRSSKSTEMRTVHHCQQYQQAKQKESSNNS
jgi:hypothetical protein